MFCLADTVLYPLSEIAGGVDWRLVSPFAKSCVFKALKVDGTLNPLGPWLANMILVQKLQYIAGKAY